MTGYIYTIRVVHKGRQCKHDRCNNNSKIVTFVFHQQIPATLKAIKKIT